MPYTRENAVQLWRAVWSSWSSNRPLADEVERHKRNAIQAAGGDLYASRDIDYQRRLTAYRERHGATYPAESTTQRWRREHDESFTEGRSARIETFAREQSEFFALLSPVELRAIQNESYALAARYTEANMYRAADEVTRMLELDARKIAERAEAARRASEQAAIAERERLARVEAERVAQIARNKHKQGLERRGHWILLPENIKRLFRALRDNAEHVRVLQLDYSVLERSVRTTQAIENWYWVSPGIDSQNRDDASLEEAADRINALCERHDWPARVRHNEIHGRLIWGHNAIDIDIDGESFWVSPGDIGDSVIQCHECASYQRSGNHYRGRSGNTYCGFECAESNDDEGPGENIMSYSTDVRSVCRELGVAKGERAGGGVNLFGLFRAQPLYLGIENEVYPLESANRLAKRVREELNKRVICKSDASISGFEIVSIPGTLDWHREFWTPWFDDPGSAAHLLEGKKRGYGMHVHMSRNALSPLAWGKLSAFMNARENGAFITRVAQREPDDYCNRSPKKVAAPESRVNMAGRHVALNFSTRGQITTECRIFQANTAKAGFLKNLEFCHAAARWAAQASVKWLLADEFLEWLDHPENKSSYPVLHGFIANKFKPEEVRA
jgi:hypothetical protein